MIRTVPFKAKWSGVPFDASMSVEGRAGRVHVAGCAFNQDRRIDIDPDTARALATSLYEAATAAELDRAKSGYLKG